MAERFNMGRLLKVALSRACMVHPAIGRIAAARGSCDRGKIPDRYRDALAVFIRRSEF
jgi:hypothetical protein